jgi:nucleoid DNA-binding protein
MAARKKAVAKKKAGAGITIGNKALTKSEIFTHLSERAQIPRKDVRAIFEELAAIAGKSLAKGPGQFTIPGLCKMVVRIRPAKKARKGINPFTGEETTFKARPKSKTVRIRPIKALKDAVQ